MAETTAHELVRVRVAFATRTKAYLCFEIFPQYDPAAVETDLVQLYILSCARIFHFLGKKKQAPMFAEFCQNVLKGSIMADGIHRPNVMVPGQTLLDEEPKKPHFQAAIQLVQEGDSRLAEWVLPNGEEEGLLGFMSAVFFLQVLIRKLTEPSLFYLMLLIGGLLEFYEQGGKAEDPLSMVEGPKYAYQAAQKYVDGERAKAGGAK